MPAAIITENQLQNWVKAPNFPLILKKANEIWEEEQKRRQAFYNFITPEMKAEFINGQIVMHSPATRSHSLFRKMLVKVLDTFVEMMQIGEVLDEKAMIELTKNSYEPDISFWGSEKSALFQENQLLFPAPDFIVEILSKGTERNDRGIKMTDYAFHGVQEYWIIDPKQQTIEQYYLPLSNSTVYALLHTYRKGEAIESRVITGFTIPVAAVFDSPTNQETLKKILNNE